MLWVKFHFKPYRQYPSSEIIRSMPWHHGCHVQPRSDAPRLARDEGQEFETAFSIRVIGNDHTSFPILRGFLGNVPWGSWRQTLLGHRSGGFLDVRQKSVTMMTFESSKLNDK